MCRSKLSAVQVKYVISATSFGSTQCTRERTSGDPKRVFARRRNAQRRCLASYRVKPPPEIGENLDGHPCAHAAGVDELTVIGVVAQQQRAEMRP